MTSRDEKMKLDDKERDVILHALGLSRRRRWAYRNHFAAGGEDVSIWKGLVDRGLASGGNNLMNEVMPYPLFRVTRLGAEAAGVGNKVPRALTNPRPAT